MIHSGKLHCRHSQLELYIHGQASKEREANEPEHHKHIDCQFPPTICSNMIEQVLPDASTYLCLLCDGLVHLVGEEKVVKEGEGKALMEGEGKAVMEGEGKVVVEGEG